MTTAALTDADVRVRDAVRRQLDWDPSMDASAIGVTAIGGTVTLTGHVDSYAAKLAAERAAQRVRGVRVVANDIEVRLRLERTDADIAQDGSVGTWLQRESAENAAANAPGISHVDNHIVVEPPSEPDGDSADDIC